MDTSERRETVTALAIRAKTDRDAIPELWGMVERYIQTICVRYCRNNSGTRLYELDDLCQFAYFGFLNAIDTFDPERGAFTTHLHYYIRRSCYLEIKRHGRDPISKASSLDKPLDDTDGITLSEAIPDPLAPEPFEAVELQALVDVILAEADTFLNIRQRRVIRECTYLGRSLSSYAKELGISREGARAMEQHAIEWLRRRKVIREMYYEYRAEQSAAIRDSVSSPCRAKSVTEFYNDFTSVVESIILSMEHSEEGNNALEIRDHSR